MKVKDLYKKLKNIPGLKVCLGEPLFKHSWFRIGGRAAVFISPKTEDSLVHALKIIRSRKKRIFIIGNGSNLLLPDNLVEKIFIRVGNGIQNIDIQGNMVRVGAGVSMQKLILAAKKLGLGGLEFASGVPASIGGAIVMNLGAFGKEIGKFVREVRVVTLDGKPKVLKKRQIKFGYRTSIFQNKKFIVTEVLLKLQNSSPRAIRKRIEKVMAKRKLSQPLSVPNAGSVFRNPNGDFAGRVIENCGLKGLRVGDAQVSSKHANFIINLGAARARDVISLIDKVKRIVKLKANIDLIPEIEIVS